MARSGAGPLLRVGAAVAVVVVSGCAPGPLTAVRLQRSVASTFANLWGYHEAELGHPHPAPPRLEATAVCRRSTPGTVQHGAGTDWVCQVVWLVDGPGTLVNATYDLDVSTDGCYAARGDGPASVNGSPSLVDLTGRQRVNPLYAFNGCVDTA